MKANGRLKMAGVVGKRCWVDREWGESEQRVGERESEKAFVRRQNKAKLSQGNRSSKAIADNKKQTLPNNSIKTTDSKKIDTS